MGDENTNTNQDAPVEQPEVLLEVHKTYFKHIGVVGLLISVVIASFLLLFVFSLETATYSLPLSNYEVQGSSSIFTPSYSIEVPKEYILNREVSNNFVKRLDHYDNTGLVGSISVTTAYVGAENMRDAALQVKQMTIDKASGHKEIIAQIEKSLDAKQLEFADFTPFTNEKGISKGYSAAFSFTRNGEVFEGTYLVALGAQHIYDVGVYTKTSVWRENEKIIDQIFLSFSPDTK